MRIGLFSIHYEFVQINYRDLVMRVGSGELGYSDPPYASSQAILYGAQEFELADLMTEIAMCKRRGAKVALSIDGIKKSGADNCFIEVPQGLFEREVFVDCGRSMLRRFQLEGRDAEDDVVSDRLLLTF